MLKFSGSVSRVVAKGVKTKIHYVIYQFLFLCDTICCNQITGSFPEFPSVIQAQTSFPTSSFRLHVLSHSSKNTQALKTLPEKSASHIEKWLSCMIGWLCDDVSSYLLLSPRYFLLFASLQLQYIRNKTQWEVL